MANWNPKANQLFLEAAEIVSPVERLAFLDRECIDDAGLRAQVLDLLEAAAAAGSFLSAPVVFVGETVVPEVSSVNLDAAASAFRQPVEDQSQTVNLSGASRTTIGPYKLLQKLGEGGMGTVYLAEQDQPVQRRVALKIIKPGMDTAQVVARFEAERQALAMMDHPHIARVFDAGTTAAGLPYFVMELVKGVPITKYCDDNRLSPRERLDLFIPVCQAIQHAHQKGIIHRDIKPTNVLIALYDGKPVPKVIDFGIAKATQQRLTERTLFTEVGQVVGTLEYMSPEQAEMNQLDVDTRSDVYSLGVLLYELLTGTTPITKQHLKRIGLVEMLRTIREEEPPKPSTRLSESGEALASISAVRKTEPAKLSKLVRGDLDWIVMKALDKDRSRRYETANGLARDIQRYLTDEVIEARPPSVGYRLRKLVKRHRTAISTSIAFLILLVVSSIVSTWQAVRATNAEKIAVFNEGKAKDAAEAESEQKSIAIAKQQEAIRERDAKDVALKEKSEALVAKTEAERQASQALNASQRTSARFALARGQSLAENGAGSGNADVGSGMLWMARALQLAPADDPELSRLARVSLARWSTKMIQLTDTYANQPVEYGGRILLLRSGQAFTLTGDKQEEIVVTDLLTGRRDEIPTDLRATAGNVMATDPSGSVMLVKCREDNCSVQYWDTTTMRPIGMTIRLPAHVFGGARAVFAPDAKHVWIGTSDGFCSVTCPDGVVDKNLIPVTRPYNSVAISPDGQTLLVAHSTSGGLSFWSTETRTEVAPVLPYTEDWNTEVVISNDGKTFAVGYSEAVRIGDMARRQWTERILKTNANCLGIALSPNGKAVSAGVHNRQVVNWRTETGARTGSPIQHPRPVVDIVYLPDGQSFLTSCEDRVVRRWTIPEESVPHRVLDPQAGMLRPPYNDGHSPRNDTFLTEQTLAVNRHRDEFVAVSRYFTARCQKLSTGETFGPTFDHGATIICAALSPDGKFLFTAGGDRKVIVWNRETGLAIGKPINHPGIPFSIVAGSDSKSLVILCGHAKDTPENKFVRLWRLADGIPVGQPKELGRSDVNGNRVVDLTHDGRRCAIGGWGRTDIYDVESQSVVSGPYFAGRWVRVVKFSPDGTKLLIGTEDSNAQLWDVETGEAAGLPLPHRWWVETVAFSPSGQVFATEAFDGTIRIWDTNSSRQVGPSLEYGRRCAAIRFIDENNLLVLDYANRIWRVPLGEPIDGTLDEINAWVEHITGNELGKEGMTKVLNAEQHKKRVGRKGRFNMERDPRSRPVPANIIGPTLAVQEYANLIQAVYQERGDGTRIARQRLEKSNYTIHGWEWDYVRNLPNPAKLVLNGNGSPAWSAAFSGDEKRIVTSHDNSVAVIWSAESGEPLIRLVGHKAGVTHAVFSSDDTRVLTCSGTNDETAKIWDAGTGTELVTLRGHSKWIMTCSFSPDGKQIATAGGDGSIKFWNALTGTEIRSFERSGGECNCLAFSPDGSHLVAGYIDRSLVLWNVADGTILWQHGEHRDQVRSVQFKGDGSQIVTASLDGTVRTWLASTGQVIHVLKTDGSGVWSAAFRADGQQIVAGTDSGWVNIWETRSGGLVSSLRAHSSAIHSVRFSRDGSRILTSGNDSLSKILEPTAGSIEIPLIGHAHFVTSAAFSPDSSRIVTSCRDATAKIWDPNTQTCLTTLEGHTDAVNSASFSADGSKVLTGSDDKSAKLWDALSGKIIATLSGHAAEIRSVAFDPSGGLAATASYDNTIKLWDLTQMRELMTLSGHKGGVRSAVFSPDGTTLLTASVDNTARLWNVKTGQERLVFRGHQEGVWRAHFDRDGKRVVTAGADSTVRIWDAHSGAQLSVCRGHVGDVFAASFNPDGTRVVSAGIDGKMVIWDSLTGVKLLELQDTNMTCNTIAFSPNGDSILGACSDRIARIWRAVPLPDPSFRPSPEESLK